MRGDLLKPADYLIFYKNTYKMNIRLTIITIISVVITLSSCNKRDDIKRNTTDLEPIQKKSFTCEKGILHFKDRNSFNKTLNMILEFSINERKKWGKELNFQSQYELYNKILNAEITLENEIYQGINEDITIQELQQLGIEKKHTDIYINNLTKGLIKEIPEENGSYSFELSIKEKGMSFIVNKQGLVIVNDTIYQYTENDLKILCDNDLSRLNELFNYPVVKNTNDIIILKYSDNTKNGYNWTKRSGWKYNSSRERYCLDVVGYSTASISLLHSVFYVEAKGQKKKWGSWNYRNDYSPIHRVSGIWSYRYIVEKNGINYTWTSVWDNDPKSPWSKTYNGTNHIVKPLSPNGYWNFSHSSYSVFDAIYMESFHFNGSFYGGSNGHYINLYK